jgi:hypothetical protein
VEFELNGRKLLALSGGPERKLTIAIYAPNDLLKV